jgi:hypothetical protein
MCCSSLKWRTTPLSGARDYPHGFVARKHEAIGGKSVVTDVMLIAELEELRRIFGDAGLVCVPRADIDDIKIVESWV